MASSEEERINLLTRDVARDPNPIRAASEHSVKADVCVVGAGIAGLSAAVESARLGRSVTLVDSLPVLGGQMVNSIVSVLLGIYGNSPNYKQFTHGLFDEMFRDLEPTGGVWFKDVYTRAVGYDEVQLGRWVEQIVQDHDIQVITGASIIGVHREDRRLREVQFATRYGTVSVHASGFVDASGDAALSWEAGLTCRLPEREIYGTQQVVIENVDEKRRPELDEMTSRAKAKAKEYGLRRHTAIAVFTPGRDIAVLNMTHIETPLDPVGAAQAQLAGRAQGDRVVEFLRSEFPECFGQARVRTYGLPGIRQTRWLHGVHQLTLGEIRQGTEFSDAVARTAWAVELHDSPTGYVWEPFDDDHVHYVPLRSMASPQADNLLAAGRCIDGDAAALSSVRVMGPCAATGMGAAHALDMAGPEGSVHSVDHQVLQQRLSGKTLD